MTPNEPIQCTPHTHHNSLSAGAVERQCRERQDDDGAPLPLGLVEGTISSTLTSLGCQFSLNVKTPDGLLRLDCLLHHHLLYALLLPSFSDPSVCCTFCIALFCGVLQIFHNWDHVSPSPVMNCCSADNIPVSVSRLFTQNNRME